MENPIKDNRIVSDKTFATRFVAFLKDIQVNDAMSDDELWYLQEVAGSLLFYQWFTATNKDEIAYLNNCHPISRLNYENIKIISNKEL
jgi:hypothetical protein